MKPKEPTDFWMIRALRHDVNGVRVGVNRMAYALEAIAAAINSRAPAPTLLCECLACGCTIAPAQGDKCPVCDVVLS